jgi:hypothetical protein
LIFFRSNESFSINENSALVKGIYKDLKYWNTWEKNINNVIREKGHPYIFKEIRYTVIYLIDSLEGWERQDWYEVVCKIKFAL